MVMSFISLKINVVLIVLILFAKSVYGTSNSERPTFQTFYNLAVTAIYADDYKKCEEYLRKALVESPDDVGAIQLLGTALLKMNNNIEGAEYMKKAVELNKFQDKGFVANYVEALRSIGNADLAASVGNKALAMSSIHPQKGYGSLYFNLAVVEGQLQNYHKALQLFRWGFSLESNNIAMWKMCGELLLDHISPVDAESFMREAVTQFPDDHYIHFLLGASLHHQTRLDEALLEYQVSERLKSDYYPVKANIGAVLQSLGNVRESLRYYEMAIPHMPNEAGLLNNYGALLGIMGRTDEEIVWLLKALELEPTMEQALVNLGGYYQDEGFSEQALESLAKALPTSPVPGLLRLRMALLMSPISTSWRQMVEERNRMHRSVRQLLEQKEQQQHHSKEAIDTTLDRIHFYIQYHGLNDRHFQELVVKAYQAHILDINGTFPTTASLDPVPPTNEQTVVTSSGQTVSSVAAPARKVRVGFISKFLGLFEPHGLLLDGVMKYLPRSHFHVIALPIARTDDKPLSPGVREAVDEVVHISLAFKHAVQMIGALDLDILVFADSMSEPMTHFLVQSRFAKIQVLFWGNPITSGSGQIDYFVSAHDMEHPFRTRMPVSDEPYTEQAVLLEGQGIWYNKAAPIQTDLRKAGLTQLMMQAAHNYTRADFQLEQGWFVFLLPQSVFKVHPLYDMVLAELLKMNPAVHVVVTGGRRPQWSKVYLKRLMAAVPESAQWRLHMVDRVSSEKFDSLLTIADVILHPFPFDGSKTSADALLARKPLVTLPTEYLRGRMGASYLKTMNMPELVARNASEYLQIATRLRQDKAFYQQVVSDIARKTDLIWEDLQVPYSWACFLSRAYGAGWTSSFEDFVRSLPDRDFNLEMQKHRVRTENRRLFDEAWGDERYLLENGAARLQSSVADANEIPRVFADWPGQDDDEHVQAVPASPPLTGSLAAGKTTHSVLESKEQDAALLKSKLVNLSGRPASAVANAETVSIVGAAGRPQDTNHIRISPLLSPVRMNSIAAEVYVASMQKKANEELMRRAASPLSLSANKDRVILNAFRAQLQNGKYSEAYKLAMSIFDTHKNDPLYLLELGATRLFSGEYQSAFDHCKQAVKFAPQASLPYACVGVSGMYLPDKEDEVVAALEQALTIQTRVDTQLAQQRRVDMQNVQIRVDGKPPTPPVGEGQLSSSVFLVSREVMEGNLIQSLRTYRRFEECLDFSHRFHDLPPPALGGAHVLAFASVDWSPRSINAIHELEQQLRAKGLLQLPRERTLVQEIRRIQQTASHVVNPSSDCLNNLADGALKNAVMGDLMRIVSLGESSRVDTRIDAKEMADSLDVQLKTGIALVTQYFSPSDPAVLRDINAALAKNLANPAITDVYLLNEWAYDFSTFPNHLKISEYVLGKRLTFASAFQFANEHLQGRLVLLANADIYFDNSLMRVDVRNSSLHDRTVVSLLKWSAQEYSLSLDMRTDSQDAWLFKSPLDDAVVAQSNFMMGLPRCDNRMAHILESNNYTVLNPAFALRAVEIQTAERTSRLYGLKDSVQGAGSNVLISDKFVF